MKSCRSQSEFESPVSKNVTQWVRPLYQVKTDDELRKNVAVVVSSIGCVSRRAIAMQSVVHIATLPDGWYDVVDGKPPSFPKKAN